jgi:signal transduction histidine kinase
LGITNFVVLNPNSLVFGVTLEIAIISLLIGKDYQLLKKEKEGLIIEMKNQELQNAGVLIDIQEAERSRIARDLHDDIGATLSTARLFLSQVDEQYQLAPAGAVYLKDSFRLLEKASNNLRSISHDLLPADFTETGLYSALQQRLEQFNQKNETRFDIVWSGNPDPLPSAAAAISVYRLVNELCMNIIKHANATIATIQVLINENEFQLLVEDNGTGMKPDKDRPGIGLKNITARVLYLKGTVYIDSNSNGTTVIINFPLTSTMPL